MIADYNKFINTFSVTKEDIIEYINNYIAYLSNDLPDDNHEYEVTFIMINMLKNLRTKVLDTPFSYEQPHGWYYELEWLRNKLSLVLVHCEEMMFGDGNSSFESTTSNHIVLLSTECRYLTVEEFATRCVVTPEAVRQWIRRGKIRNAFKAGNGWLIPETAAKPKRGYIPVDYQIVGPIDHLYNEYPFLKNVELVSINQNINNRNKYDVWIMHAPFKRFTLSIKEREAFELALLSTNQVLARDSIGLEPTDYKKKTRYIWRNGSLLKEKDVRKLEKLQKELLENCYSLNVVNITEVSDDPIFNSFTASIDCADENDFDTKTLVNIPIGYILPSHEEYSSSLFSDCDAISIDLATIYEEFCDFYTNQINATIINKCKLTDNADYTKLLLIPDVVTENEDGLKSFLKYCPLIVNNIANIKYGIIAIILNKEEKEQKMSLYHKAKWYSINHKDYAIVYKSI